MANLTSYYVVEFENDEGTIEPYFYYGPAMDIEEWSSFIANIRKQAIISIKKEKGNLNCATVKFRIDRILRERGFFKNSINVAEIQKSYTDETSPKVNPFTKTRASTFSNASKTRKASCVKVS